MAISSSWQFIGSLQSPWYRAFDALRRRLNRRLVAFLLDELARHGGYGVKPGEAGGLRTIEAGSGPAFASSLLRASPEVSLAICLDIDWAALAEARRRDPSLAAVVGDLRQLPFRDGAFSLAFNNSTVEHLDDPWTAVREMRRICHDDGIVYVGAPYAWGPLFFQPLLRRTRIGVWLGPVFTKPSLERLIRQAGLRPLRFRTFFWRFFVGVTASPGPQETATQRICDTRVQPSA